MEASKTTITEPTPVSKLEVQEHEKELRSNPEAEASAQDCVECPEHAVEPSKVVDVPEEDVTMEVGLALPECQWDAYRVSEGC